MQQISETRLYRLQEALENMQDSIGHIGCVIEAGETIDGTHFNDYMLSHFRKSEYLQNWKVWCLLSEKMRDLLNDLQDFVP